jgi:hypothetical protein
MQLGSGGGCCQFLKNSDQLPPDIFCESCDLTWDCVPSEMGRNLTEQSNRRLDRSQVLRCYLPGGRVVRFDSENT